MGVHMEGQRALFMHRRDGMHWQRAAVAGVFEHVQPDHFNGVRRLQAFGTDL